MVNEKNKDRKFGVRVFKISEDTLLIKQTIKRGNRPTDEYIIDGQKERHVGINDDSAIAEAVREGLNGGLKAGK